jgi:hypothetical protein
MPSRDGDTQERTHRTQRWARPRASQSGRMRWKTLLEDGLENPFSSFHVFIPAREVQNGMSGATPARHRSESSFAPFSSRLAAKPRRSTLFVARAPRGEGADRNDRRDGSEQWIT